MRTRSAMPWLSFILIALALLNPIGFEFMAGAFSGEALSRNIAGPIVLTALVVLCAIALIEFAIRRMLIRRAERQAIVAERK